MATMTAESDWSFEQPLALHRPSGPAPGGSGSCQLFRHQEAVFGAQAQIVSDNPEPASLWMITICSNTDGQPGLPGQADNVGRLSIPGSHIDWIGIEQALDPRKTGIGLELHPE